MSDFKQRAETNRRLRQMELAAEVKRKDWQPPSFDAQASWYPPRPIIKKDKQAIEEIHGKNP